MRRVWLGCGERWDLARRGEIWRDLVRSGEMWWDVVRCGEMWRDVARCGEMWGESAHLPSGVEAIHQGEEGGDD